MSDLSTVVRRGQLQLPPGTTDYEIHGCFVEMMETRNPASKTVDRMLEKKYRCVTAKIRRVDSTEGLIDSWEDAWRRNEIPGAYWAIVSHPLFDMDIRRRVFGDVHMLSHLLGATRRTEHRKRQQLDRQYAALQGRMALVKSVFRRRITAKDHIIGELQAKLFSLRRVERQLRIAHETIHEMRRDNGTYGQEAEIKSLQAALSKERNRAMLAEENLAAARKAENIAAALNADALRRIQALHEENSALESELSSALGCPEENAVCNATIESRGVNLCGRKIMYVGGRSSLVKYYRALVERRGGEFLYHDGGIENSMDMLKSALNSADAVICPVDCVSHNACLSVKQACRHMSKPFVPLRSAGLSSLAHGIQEIA